MWAFVSSKIILVLHENIASLIEPMCLVNRSMKFAKGGF